MQNTFEVTFNQVTVFILLTMQLLQDGLKKIKTKTYLRFNCSTEEDGLRY